VAIVGGERPAFAPDDRALGCGFSAACRKARTAFSSSSGGVRKKKHRQAIRGFDEMPRAVAMSG
jgi:hypothetical protein